MHRLCSHRGNRGRKRRGDERGDFLRCKYVCRLHDASSRLSFSLFIQATDAYQRRWSRSRIKGWPPVDRKFTVKWTRLESARFVTLGRFSDHLLRKVCGGATIVVVKNWNRILFRVSCIVSTVTILWYTVCIQRYSFWKYKFLRDVMIYSTCHTNPIEIWNRLMHFLRISKNIRRI